MEWKFDPAFISKFLGAIREGASQISMIASICACAQIIIAILSYTGLGVKISTFIVDLSGGNLFLTLVFTMLTCIILGWRSDHGFLHHGCNRGSPGPD